MLTQQLNPTRLYLIRPGEIVVGWNDCNGESSLLAGETSTAMRADGGGAVVVLAAERARRSHCAVYDGFGRGRRRLGASHEQASSSFAEWRRCRPSLSLLSQIWFSQICLPRSSLSTLSSDLIRRCA
ncbi:hypothetical protein BT93_L5645 [Corymbia citriodora subsp. variegata]|uniref:Uncharacterized protein n=1 Tax=Corymbia citriodora subsp. variegata TaxID=360336 RepID=A0A8T0CRX1_CORYI|nr:hypothetical protein BT93_L5645 [Corymbia citriodora subsp. variegata]